MEDCQECESINNIIEKFKEWFFKIKCTFQEFTFMSFDNRITIKEYSEKKLDVGRKQGFSNAIILEGLA